MAKASVFRVPMSPRDLNRKLADLEDQGLHSFRDALLSSDHLLLEQLVSVMAWTTVEEKGLVDLVHRLFQAYGREEELLLWAIKHEIAITDRSPELFRMQSFATQMLFKMFFTERGHAYLEKTVMRVIETVADMKEDNLELVPNGVTVSVQEATANLQFILDVADDLFKLLDQELKYCPTEIRRGFNLMQEVASKKFAEVEDSVVPVCFFLRFLCPTLLQPEQFSLTTAKMTSDATKALLIISKVLQNIANGIIKNNITSYAPHDDQVLQFINDHIYTVHDFCVKLADKPQIEQDAAVALKPSPSTEKDQENTLDKVYHFVMLGEFRKYLDEQEARQDEREKSYREHLSKMEQFLHTLDSTILADEAQWKPSRSDDGVSFSTSRTTSFWYRVEGTIKASLSQIQTTLESLEFDDWMTKVFSEKLLAVEKCQVVDHLENLQEEWLLRFKFPFPFGNKSAYVTRTFYAPNANSFHMLLLPIPGRSKSTLDLALMFKKKKDEAKICSMTAFYALNPDGAFPAQMSTSHAKHLYHVFESLLQILSMEFQVAGKKVEIDYMSQQRKERSNLEAKVVVSKERRAAESFDKTDSAESLAQTHSSGSDDTRPQFILSRRRSASAAEEAASKKSAEGSGDSTGHSSGNASAGSGPNRSNSLTRIKKQRSNPKILSSSQSLQATTSATAKSTPPVLTKQRTSEPFATVSSSGRATTVVTRQTIRDTTDLSESADLISDEEGYKNNEIYIHANEEGSNECDSDPDLVSEDR